MSACQCDDILFPRQTCGVKHHWRGKYIPLQCFAEHLLQGWDIYATDVWHTRPQKKTKTLVSCRLYDTVGFKLEPCFGLPGEDEWAEGTEGRHKLQCCYTCLLTSRVLAECYGALAGHKDPKDPRNWYQVFNSNMLWWRHVWQCRSW